MSMKLSYRDKVIFIVVIVLAILIAGVLLVVKPKYEDLEASKTKVTSKQSELASVQAEADTLDDLKAQLKSSINSVEDVQEGFIDETEYGETYQIEQYLNGVLEELEYIPIEYALEVVSASSASEYYYQKRAVAYDLKASADLNGEVEDEVYYTLNKSWPSADPSVTIAGSIVQLTFSFNNDNDYQEFYDALDMIAADDKTIYIYSVEASHTYELTTGVNSEATGAETLEVVYTIYVYELYPMDTSALE